MNEDSKKTELIKNQESIEKLRASYEQDKTYLKVSSKVLGVFFTILNVCSIASAKANDLHMAFWFLCIALSLGFVKYAVDSNVSYILYVIGEKKKATLGLFCITFSVISLGYNTIKSPTTYIPALILLIAVIVCSSLKSNKVTPAR